MIYMYVRIGHYITLELIITYCFPYTLAYHIHIK